MDQQFERGVVGDDKQVVAALGVLVGNEDGLRQPGGADDVDGEVVGGGSPDGSGEQRGGIVDADLQRVPVPDGNDDTLLVLSRSKRHLQGVAILPEAGIDEGRATLCGGDGADGVHAGLQVREGERAVGGGKRGLAETLGSDGDGGLDWIVGLVADGAGEGGGGRWSYGRRPDALGVSGGLQE